MTYLLTEQGKRITWKEWQKMGGNMISNHEIPIVTEALGSVNSWERNDVTLGDIAEASYIAERELARFAYHNYPNLNLPKQNQ